MVFEGSCLVCLVKEAGLHPLRPLTVKCLLDCCGMPALGQAPGSLEVAPDKGAIPCPGPHIHIHIHIYIDIDMHAYAYAVAVAYIYIYMSLIP